MPDRAEIRRAAALAAVLALGSIAGWPQVEPRLAVINAPYVTTPPEVIDGMLSLAGVRKNDTVYDLGCGDGRIPIAAARKFGARGVGIEIDPRRVAEAAANARKVGVAHLVDFREQDIFDADLREATVVTMYLLPGLHAALAPKLFRELRPGARIVAHSFPMGSVKPDREMEVQGCRIFRWTVPAH